MDREIPQAERRRIRIRRIVKICIPAVALVACVVGAMSLVQPSVKMGALRFGSVDRGQVETTVNASGRVLPGFEQVINSPVDSRLVELFCREGDKVEEGTPLMRLDLRTVETELAQLADQRTSKLYEMEQAVLDHRTQLSDLEMQVKVKEMAVNRLAVEVANERRLDSIGSGTGDRVRQAELAHSTGCLELSQLRQRLENARKTGEAALEMKRLELEIFDRNMAEKRRTFEDASLRAPRAGTVTFLYGQIGSRIAAGERVAVLSDLSRFKVEGEVVDSYASRIAVGGRVMVRVGSKMIPGTVVRITPQSKDGAISFSVALDDDDAEGLRSGLKTDVYILCEVYDDVVRIPAGSYYKGEGRYDMFVMEGSDLLVRRSVVLGAANYDYVVVKEGLSPGERVIVSDMTDYKSRKQLKLRK